MELPSCGVSGLTIEGTDDATRTFGSMLTGPMSASNGRISLAVCSDGRVTLAQQGGPVFRDLFLYEDAGDCGDGWTRGIPVHDTVFRSPGSVVTTAIEEDGPLRTTFRIERQLRLPRRLDPRTKARSDERVTLEITDCISLEKYGDAVRVRTVINNTSEDHRLRVLFPTGCNSDVSFADTPFAVVEREIPIPESTALWQERINEEKAFTSFCGIADTRGGLAVVSPAGLHEYAVLQTPERELAITLFRSFRKTVFKPEEPDGQLAGRLEFEYALVPFAGAPDAPQLLNLAAAMQAPVRFHATGGPVSTKSFLVLRDGTAVVTALKPAADGQGGIVRFWNPTGTEIENAFSTLCPVVSACYCNLNEEPGSGIEIKEGTIPVRVPAGGISTVRFTW